MRGYSIGNIARCVFVTQTAVCTTKTLAPKGRWITPKSSESLGFSSLSKRLYLEKCCTFAVRCEELAIIIKMKTIKRRKRFVCPYCGKRLQLKNLFITKETFVCRGCGRELKVKKQIVPFKWGFFIAFAPTVLLGNIMRLNGVSFIDNMLILLGLGIVIISIICLVVYLYSEYEWRFLI